MKPTWSKVYGRPDPAKQLQRELKEIAKLPLTIQVEEPPMIHSKLTTPFGSFDVYVGPGKETRAIDHNTISYTIEVSASRKAD